MITLMFALLVSPAPTLSEQAVQATLQSCAMEGGRWVCRYAVPDIEIVPIPGSDIVADAPASILGEARTADAPRTDAPAVDSTPRTAPATTPTETGPVLPMDAGALTERETRLVERCAEAGWMSLCLPDDRRAARTLREKETAYLAVRRDVTRLLGDDQCDTAVRTALDGGYLNLARETRDYCAAPTTEAVED